MPTFDFACDARVSISFEAATREVALSRWHDFCYDLNRGNGIYGPEVDQFQVALAFQEPEIEEKSKQGGHHGHDHLAPIGMG